MRWGGVDQTHGLSKSQCKYFWSLKQKIHVIQKEKKHLLTRGVVVIVYAVLLKTTQCFSYAFC